MSDKKATTILISGFVGALIIIALISTLIFLVLDVTTPPIEYIQDVASPKKHVLCQGDFLEADLEIITRKQPNSVLILVNWYDATAGKMLSQEHFEARVTPSFIVKEGTRVNFERTKIQIQEVVPDSVILGHEINYIRAMDGEVVIIPFTVERC